MLGSSLLYFNSNDEEKISSVLLFVGVYILLDLILLVVKKYSLRKKSVSEKYPLPEMDERIEKMSLKLMAQIFGLSHLVGSVILFILYITDKTR